MALLPWLTTHTPVSHQALHPAVYLFWFYTYSLPDCCSTLCGTTQAKICLHLVSVFCFFVAYSTPSAPLTCLVSHSACSHQPHSTITLILFPAGHWTFLPATYPHPLPPFCNKPSLFHSVHLCCHHTCPNKSILFCSFCCKGCLIGCLLSIFGHFG